MTINVRLLPPIVGEIEAFIVINTPGTKYYEGVMRKIQAKV